MKIGLGNLMYGITASKINRLSCKLFRAVKIMSHQRQRNDSKVNVKTM